MEILKYKKETPRLNVKYIDSDTDEIIFEVNNRTWMDVGELLRDHYVAQVIKDNVDNPPDNVMVMVIGEYKKL